jgi:hypothetical protein
MVDLDKLRCGEAKEFNKMTYVFFKDIKSNCSEKERKQLNDFFTRVLEEGPRHKK